jgi:Fe-S-cluster-containing hydrogenase component 2
MECGACRIHCPFGAVTVESGVGCAAALMVQAVTKKKQRYAVADRNENVSRCRVRSPRRPVTVDRRKVYIGDSGILHSLFGIGDARDLD